MMPTDDGVTSAYTAGAQELSTNKPVDSERQPIVARVRYVHAVKRVADDRNLEPLVISAG